MRRWEDWERSRLRKLRREERRRRDFERAHPSGYISGERDFLVAPDTRSQYDGSDTLSLNSSDDDHWGTQIGGYNEHNSQFPPPPTAFIPLGEALQSAKTVDGAELEAMLQMGFDDRPSPTSPVYTPRFQLSDGELPNGGGYTPLTQSVSPSPIQINRDLPVISQRLMPHPENQSGAHAERYGPLGPLDPSVKV
jgi:chitin synthase